MLCAREMSIAARLLCAVCVVLPLLLHAADAEDENPFRMSYVLTKDLQLIYYPALEHLVPYAASSFANSHAWQRHTFGWTPSQRTGIFLKDFADYGGGAAWVAPFNTVSIDVAPPSLAFETFSAAERMYSLMNHELVHVATGDVASSDDLFWRRLLLGKVPVQSQNPESLLYAYLTSPRFHVPRWYLEGHAVFLETWMGGGLGRAQGGYDEMVFRAMVRDGARFYDPLGLVSRGVLVDFQAGVNAYLYGTRFVTWLAYAYGADKAIAWLRRDEGSQRHYADQFQYVFGTPLETAWNEWIAFEGEFQRANLERVRTYPITPHRVLAGAAAGSVSRTYFDASTGVLYGAFRTPGVQEHVGELDTRDGSYRKLGDIRRGMLYRVASFAFDAERGIAFYTDRNHAFRDLMSLDVKTGEQQVLFPNARIGEIVVNPADHALWGVRHDRGLATLVRLPPPYTTWYRVHEFPYGVVPSDLDISPDGKLMSASVAEITSDQFVRVWSIEQLLAGDLKPRAEFSFGQSVPESFVFSRDGRFLYGSSYYTGVSNIFRCELANGAIETVSNAEVGFFRPADMGDGRLFVLAYTAQGFVPAVIDARPLQDVSNIKFLGTELVNRYPVVKTWQVPPPKIAEAEQAITGRGEYEPVKQLRLANAYPVLQGYKSSVGVGYRVNFEDPIRFASVSAVAAWTPGNGDEPGGQQAHFHVQGSYLGWRAELAWNKSDFYDLFGPTKRSRKGSQVKLGYDHFLVYDDPRKLVWSNDAAYYDKIDTLPQAQNVASGFTRLATAQTQLKYSDVQRSLGAVDDERGVNWNTSLYVSRADTRFASQLRGGIDLGFALPWAHSSLWSRTAVGASSGDLDNPNANFYFGGFGNNIVDNAAVKRYRELDSMPGFEIDEIAGRRFAKQMFEWTLPPYVFESAGTPGLHVTWMRPAVFATALWADAGGSVGRRDVASAGGQLDFRISTLYWYEMMLSFGYARGFERSQPGRNEWMVSLKVL
jgi:hypothetical protein